MNVFAGKRMSQRLVIGKKEFDFSSGVCRKSAYDRYACGRPEIFDSRTKMLEETKKFFPEGARYLGSILNDSPIISIEYRKHDFIQIAFNDIRYIDFCWAIRDLEKVRIPYRRMVFPVVLEFSGLKKCSVYWCNRNRKLLPLKTEKYLGKIKKIEEDEIQEVGDGYISLALDLETTISRGPKNNLIMNIVAENLSVNEEQHKALNSIIDKKYSSLLTAFRDEVSNRICGDTGIIEEFIQKNKHLIGE